MVSIAHLAKQRICLQNALQWLYVNDDNQCSRVEWLIQDVMQYKNQEVLNALVKEESHTIYDKWSFNPSNIGFDIIQAHELLIFVNLFKHFKV